MTNEELAVKVQSGQGEYMLELWKQNQGLLNMIANRYIIAYESAARRLGVTLDDLIQCGYIALHNAAMAYNPQGEYKFTTYLNYHIKNEFRAVLGCRSSKRDGLNFATSLDCPISEDDENGDTFGDLVEDSSVHFEDDVIESVYLDELHKVLDECMDMIGIEQKAALTARYYDGLTALQYAQLRNVSKAQACMMYQKGLRAMRSNKIRSRLKSFMPEQHSIFTDIEAEFRILSERRQITKKY